MNWRRWLRLPSKKSQINRALLELPIETRRAMMWAMWDLYTPAESKICSYCESKLIPNMDGLFCMGCEYFKSWVEE